jgi:hypothetical protein
MVLSLGGEMDTERTAAARVAGLEKQSHILLDLRGRTQR